MKLLDNPNSVKALNEYCIKSMIENMSILARTESGEIAGVCINTLTCKDDPTDEPITDSVYGKIVNFLAFVSEDSKLFEKFPGVDCFMYMSVMSVDRKFQGHGIAKVLIDKSRQVIS
ncbi:n-acetyltransferase-related [Holotrichia oblita]|uniref:N-acetyltransferase-related n=1 Tax=Holotrichia oblita TaxID=644536 RepID=A0ACB9T9S5_HOLOL|nr:n-acetyltransferase-related [Holotrichia oblita]